MTSQFLWGMLVMSTFVAGLFFLRFFVTTRDRFFLIFASAFWVLSLNWLGLAVLNPIGESRHYIYIVRLAAFVLFIVGILDKNRRPPGEH